MSYTVLGNEVHKASFAICDECAVTVLDTMRDMHARWHARKAPETWFNGERLSDELAGLVKAIWFEDGVRLQLAFGDCVAIARTALAASRG